MWVEHAEAWEKVVRKLRARAMPPAGRPRPDKADYAAVASVLETALDQAAAANPNPGRSTTHRLNRTEYANAIRDLLALEVDGRALLPPDDADLGFDNMADILSMSPALLERYLSAARKITRLALGDPSGDPTTETHVVPKLRFQDHRMSEDLPFGSRGGVAFRHNFPLDAEYDIKIRLAAGQLYGYIRGLQKRQQIEVRLDGKRVALFSIGGAPGTPPPQTFTGTVPGDRTWEDYTLHTDDELEFRVSVMAGPRVLGVSFIQGRSERDGVLQTACDREDPRDCRAVELAVGSARSGRRAGQRLRPVQRHGARGDTDPPKDPGVSPRGRRGRRTLCAGDSVDRGAARLPAPPDTLRHGRAGGVLPAGTAGRGVRDGDPAGSREHPHRSGVPVPHRAGSG